MRHTFLRLSDHVYWMSPEQETDRPILGIVVGEKYTLIVDSGASPSHARDFLNALTAKVIRAPRYCVLTHWHTDHSFGSSAYNIPIIAHHMTIDHLRTQASYAWDDESLDQRVEDGLEIPFVRDALKQEMSNEERKNLKVIVPDIAIWDQMEFNLGGVTCQVRHVGGEHSEDSCVVYIPEDGVLFLGDCAYPNIHQLPRHYTLDRFMAITELILGYDAQWFIESHAPRPADRNGIERDYLQARRIGRLVESHQGDMEMVQHTFVRETGNGMTEEELEIAELFVNGLPQVIASN